MNEIVAYIRYSDTKQDDGYSIEYQTSEIKYYAERNGFEIDKYYIDKAHTAKQVAGREEFFQMINAVKEKRVKTLIVYKLSRLFRNALESAKYRELLRNNNVKLVSVTEAVDEGTSSGRLNTNILASIDQYTSETISDHVKSSMREMARQGYYTGGIVRFGYALEEIKHGTKKRKKFIPHPEESLVVKRIFELFVDGFSLASIQQRLISEKIYTRKGNAFTRSQISKIISDDMYIGVYRFKTKGYDDIVIADGVPALVDKMLFYAANEIKDKKNDKKPEARKTDTVYTLTGKIICAKCGGYMRGVSVKNKTANGVRRHCYYMCKNKHAYKTCDAKAIRKDFIEPNVLRSIYNLILNDDKIKQLAEIVVSMCYNSPSDLDEQIKKKKKEQSWIVKTMENIIDTLGDRGGKAGELANKRIDKLEKELTQVERALYALQERKKTEVTVEAVEAYMRKMFEKATSNDDEEIKIVFETFVDKIVVSEERVNITLNGFSKNLAPQLDETPAIPLHHSVYRH